jgi:hypothetical protein
MWWVLSAVDLGNIAVYIDLYANPQESISPLVWQAKILTPLACALIVGN